MGAFVAAVALIHEKTGAHVQALHHIPADGAQRLRGHGALLGAADVTVVVEKLSDQQRTATVQKTNDGEEGERVVFDLLSVELHRDEETGQVTTAPVVVPTDDTPVTARPSRKLSDRQSIAVSALHRLVAARGEPLPTTFNLPAGVMGVPLGLWREELTRCHAIPPDAKSPREDFRRLKNGLQTRGAIAIRDDFVWAL
jgi:hypothetical protein